MHENNDNSKDDDSLFSTNIALQYIIDEYTFQTRIGFEYTQKVLTQNQLNLKRIIISNCSKIKLNLM